MINIGNPVTKKIIENLHKAIERKSKSFSSTSYDEYVLENRVIKLFCEDKSLTPRDCADEMNARYQTELRNEDVIKILKSMQLSHQHKRAELIDWAEEIVKAFVQALTSRKQKDYDDFVALRNKVIHTHEGERYKIQWRIACLMLYVKHPELDSGNDADTIEKFGNAYMKHFLYDATDFLKNICGKDTVQKNYDNLTFNDFLLFLQTEYPELGCNFDFSALEKFDGVLMKQLLSEAANFFRDLSRADNNDDSDFDITVEDFLQNDPDAQNMLIAPTVQVSVD